MAPFEALYGRRCRSPIGWFEPAEAKLYGTNLVKDALEKVKWIQERLRIAQSREMSYVDQKARCVIYGRREGSLESLAYKGDYEIRKEGQVEPTRYHTKFSHVLDFNTTQLDESLGYEEKPVAIITRQDRQLRSKRIFVVKVQ
ncbi:uncharacterized protein [Nicotiana sylvestris]|uniref:uncharacterized protein n=1 Tax=Nicotiana sylvestris TaxID=4096 RepID=UPI00388C966A